MRKTAFFSITACLAIPIIGLWNVFPEEKYLVDGPWNYLIAIVAFSIPWCIFAATAVRAARSPLKIILLVLSGIVSLATAIPLLGNLMDGFFQLVNEGEDKRFELLSESSRDGIRVRVYRLNGGATTNYYILVRQEEPVGFGIVAVKRIFGKDRGYEARIESFSQDGIHLSIDRGAPLTIPIRPIRRQWL